MKSPPGRWSVPAGLRSVLQDRFYRDSAWLIVALLVVNLSNYALNASIGRLLGPDRFGEIAALLSLYFIVSVPTSAVQTLMTREVSQSADRRGPSAAFQTVRALVLPFAIAIAVLALFASPLVSAFLHLDSQLPALLLAPLLAFALVVPLYRGVLQGQGHFGALTANVAAEAAVRLLGSVALVLLGLGAAGVLGAFGAALIAALALGKATVAHRHLKAVDPRGWSPRSWRPRQVTRLVPFIASIGAVTALYNLDVVLARHFQGGAAGGIYAAMSLIGRALFYVTSSVGGAIVASPDLALPGTRARVLAKGVAIVAGCAMVGEIILLVAARPAAVALFGSSYEAAAPGLPVLGIGMVALAVTNLLANFLLAMRTMRFLGVLAASLVVEGLLISLRHGTTVEIAAGFTIATLAAVAGLAVCSVAALRQPAWEVAP